MLQTQQRKRTSNLMPLPKPTGIALASLALFGLVLAGAISFFVVKHPSDPAEGAMPSVVAAPVYRHPLTGRVVDAEVALLPWVTAVMVENSYDAWPLSGLDQAFLVIEAPVEGGIPRFEAFFAEDAAVEKIGPVRSARPYYLDWAQELDAMYAHVGGSPEALELLEVRNLLDLNEFFHGDSFWRASNRYAPHNAYTSTELLSEVRESILTRHEHASTPTYEAWAFKEDAPTTDDVDLAIDFAPGSTYDLTWKYQKETNTYLRDQKGMSTEPIIANNVAVIYTDITSIDEKDRRSVRTLGEGDALVAQDGKTIEARWKKPTLTDRLRFYTLDGMEIAMNAGATWIEILEGDE